jgi:hypothetical protein
MKGLVVVFVVLTDLRFQYNTCKILFNSLYRTLVRYDSSVWSVSRSVKDRNSCIYLWHSKSWVASRWNEICMRAVIANSMV